MQPPLYQSSESYMLANINNAGFIVMYCSLTIVRTLQTSNLASHMVERILFVPWHLTERVMGGSRGLEVFPEYSRAHVPTELLKVPATGQHKLATQLGQCIYLHSWFELTIDNAWKRLKATRLHFTCIRRIA